MSELLPDDLPDNVRVTSVNEVMAVMSSGPLLTVCFDLDGCLVDTRAAFTESLNEALHEHGLPTLPKSSLHRYIGPPLRGTLVELVDELLGDPDDVDAILAAYRRHYRHASLRLTTRVPGIRSALNALDLWVRAGVVTSKPLPFAVPIIDAVGLRRQVAFVEGPSLEATEETKTETLARALDRWGRSDVAVVIGDRAEDIAAGHANEAVTVGVTWGIGDEEELRDAGAASIVTDPAELPDLLRAIRAEAGGVGPGAPQR
ncbi:MAG: HAD hydrolase-like protein [Actinobacteria bacterium]|nr:HAD hydrolase-like protein [Actinomycetota bacterium]